MTAFSFLPVSLLVAAGCQPVVCPCPSGGAQLTLNPDVQSTIVGVKGDSCSSASPPPNCGFRKSDNTGYVK